MKSAPTPIPVMFQPTFAIKTTIVTREMTDATAAAARQMEPVPRDDPAWAENPNFPWGPLDWPAPIDCAILDAGRTPRQELAA